MKVGFGSDGCGLQLKIHLIRVLQDQGHIVEDFGVHAEGGADETQPAIDVATSVANEMNKRGVLICGTGIGHCIAANKLANVRAAYCSDAMTAEFSREYNDANVVCLSSDQLSVAQAEDVVRAFFRTPFAGQ